MQFDTPMTGLTHWLTGRRIHSFELNYIGFHWSTCHVCSRSFLFYFLNSGSLCPLGVVFGLSRKNSVDHIVWQFVTGKVEQSDHDIGDGRVCVL